MPAGQGKDAERFAAAVEQGTTPRRRGRRRARARAGDRGDAAVAGVRRSRRTPTRRRGPSSGSWPCSPPSRAARAADAPPRCRTAGPAELTAPLGRLVAHDDVDRHRGRGADAPPSPRLPRPMRRRTPAPRSSRDPLRRPRSARAAGPGTASAHRTGAGAPAARAHRCARAAPPDGARRPAAAVSCSRSPAVGSSPAATRCPATPSTRSSGWRSRPASP